MVQDTAGNRLAFNGSTNETAAGWKHNWESFNVFTSWGGTAAYVEQEVATFAALWANKAKRVLTLDVPEAVRADLLRFMPTSDLPARLAVKETGPRYVVSKPVAPPAPIEPPPDERRETWRYIRIAPTLPNGGEQVGEATCAVTPWPHQVRAFERLYRQYASGAPKLLIADEVGLGKTIQAGLLLRQAWLAGRARRILILTPAAVMRQWQLELREKFNLNWPVYDNGCLHWYPSPGWQGHHEREVSRAEWHQEPVVIASSHLMRRRDREKELCEAAEPWDLIVLDEAHHARRKGAGSVAEEGPNALLRLMRRLRQRTNGLVLLTATPMQVDPVELWDLLDLLGLPATWDKAAFLRFFHVLGKPAPSHTEFDELAVMFRAAESAWGTVAVDAVTRVGVSSSLRAKGILSALRDPSSIPRKALATGDRQAAIRLMRATTPVSRLVSRHTRDLLRRYHEAGKLDASIATREVRDEFVDLSPEERAVYEAVEDYISTTYNAAAQVGGTAKNAVGFVMTVYRRRLASSFRALKCTLESRVISSAAGVHQPTLAAVDDVSDDESRDEIMDAEEATELERQARQIEEQQDVAALLGQVKALPPDTKARELRKVLAGLRDDGYAQAMVFTQFTDTMDFLRAYLVSRDVAERADGGMDGEVAVPRILCFSGRGGEALGPDGTWRPVSRDEVKRCFREAQADVLLCTDAAAEGLNFQFCGALVNYDMPWNPMRVEQRIGRIDRLGQRYPVVRIVNLHYRNTVEADVYAALRDRIKLFQSVVGRLQPILAELPRRITATVLRAARSDQAVRARAASEIISRVDALEADESGLDLDVLADEVMDMPARPAPALDLARLDAVVRRVEAMPPGIAVRALGPREYGYLAPGMSRELRITTDADYYEAHADSVELWSPGAPVFPDPHDVLGGAESGSASIVPQTVASYSPPGP